MILSQEQKKAAFCDSKKALVLAPAGSGKTRVLISKIGHLIKNGVSPYEILDFTFTRKASGELKDRLEKEVGSQAHKIKTGTIHGVALKFLQTYGELVGLRPDKITVYGSWEEQFLLKDVAKEIGFYAGKAWKKVKKGEVEEAFNLFYTTGNYHPELLKANTLMDAFFLRCRENNALTYGTILTEFFKLIPLVSQYLNLRHILVDEVQDLDPLQWEIINKLCEYTGASLFAIGDIRQSIFSFRGADPEYLIRNKHLFDVYNLKDNYRSSANIVEAANKLIAHNPLDLGEPMKAIRTDRYDIIKLEDMDSNELLGYFKAMATVPIKQDTAVLASNHYLLKKLSRLLDEAGIKHEYIGKKTGLVRSESFRRFHSFLKLIVNHFDNFSFLLIKDYLGLYKEEYGEIRVNAVEHAKSHFRVWQGNAEAFVWMVEATYLDFDSTIDWMKDINFGFNTEEIFTFVYSWILDNPTGTISQYLNWLATFDIQDEIKDENDGLQLMTIHAAKGLEFSTVILAGLNEGIFSDSRAVKENDLTSEIRLMYVAMTRAEDQLIFTSRPVEDKYGKKSPVSRFIEWAINS